MRVKVALVSLLILSWVLAIDFSLVGCSRTLNNKKPSIKDIAGTWMPDSKTLEYIKSEGRYKDYDKIKLIFKDDGNFEAILPDWYFIPGGKSGSTVRSISGKWEILTTNDRVWSVLISYEATSMLHVRWDGSSYMLYSFVGDADNNKTMDFVKLR